MGAQRPLAVFCAGDVEGELRRVGPVEGEAREPQRIEVAQEGASRSGGRAETVDARCVCWGDGALSVLIGAAPSNTSGRPPSERLPMGKPVQMSERSFYC